LDKEKLECLNRKKVMLYRIPKYDGPVTRVVVIQTPKLSIHLAAEYVERQEEVRFRLAILVSYSYPFAMSCTVSLIQKERYDIVLSFA